MEIICWPISASPGTRKIPLDFIAVGDWADCFSVAFYWSLPGIRILIIGVIVVFFYQQLVDIIVVCIIWNESVMLLPWIIQGCREKLIRHINNSAPSVKTNPSFLMFFIESFHWRAKFNHSLGDAYLHFHQYPLTGFVYFTCCVAFCVLFSCADTGWQINLAQYFPFLSFE